MLYPQDTLPLPSSYPLANEMVAVEVAGKMDAAPSARPSRRFQASSDLAFSIELELDAGQYPRRTR